MSGVPTINLLVPQTPRTAASKPQGVTPLFSFGLGFLPSFPFNSPRNLNMMNALLPQRFFQSATNLQRALSKHDDHLAPEHAKSHIFNSLTPPNSSKNAPNKFLDSLALSVLKPATDHSEDAPANAANTSSASAADDSVDLWSLANDSANASNMTSIYEEDPQNAPKELSAFLTPNKLFLVTPQRGRGPALPSKLPLAPNLVPLQPKDLSGDLSQLKLDLTIQKVKKKRRISDALGETPSRSLATQIETIASPSRPAKTSPTASKVATPCSATSEGLSKVWNPELDEVLLSAYAKYKVFKEKQVLESTSVLKNTSQNKVLSRMLFNKAGVSRTSKQIASRLFRLTKASKKSGSSPVLNDDIDELMRTPLDELVSGQASASNELNDAIDKELEDLLSSPPILDIDFGTYDFKPVSPAPQTKNPGTDAAVVPAELSVAFQYKTIREKHHFTRLDTSSFSNTSLSTAELKKKLGYTQDVLEDFESITNMFKSQPVSLLYLSSRLNFKTAFTNSTSTPVSPFSNAASFSLSSGSFQAYLKLAVSPSLSNRAQFLSWRCESKVYDSNRRLFSCTDHANGYLNRDTGKYDFQVPFLRQFWAGYLSYLDDGAGDHDRLRDLKIIQVIYETSSDDSGPSDNDTIHACLLHDFKPDDSTGLTKLNVLELSDWNEAQNGPRDQEIDDDNETVLADSLPFKQSSSPAIKTGPPVPKYGPEGLSIDVSRANTNPPQGPTSAPIYNASLVQKFNKHVLKQQDNNGQLQSPHRPHFRGHHQSVSGESMGSIAHSQSSSCLPAYAQTRPRLPARAKSMVAHALGDSLPFIGSSQMNTPGFSGANMATNTAPEMPQMQPVMTNNQVLAPYHMPQDQFKMPGHFQPLNDAQLQQQQMYLYYQQQQQQQQQLSMQMQNKNQPFYQNIALAPASQTQFFQPMKPYVEVNKENLKPKGNQITFGPIVEYDPSKGKVPASNLSKNGLGVIRMAPQVTMYKPKQKRK